MDDYNYIMFIANDREKNSLKNCEDKNEMICNIVQKYGTLMQDRINVNVYEDYTTFKKIYKIRDRFYMINILENQSDFKSTKELIEKDGFWRYECERVFENILTDTVYTYNSTLDTVIV